VGFMAPPLVGLADGPAAAKRVFFPVRFSVWKRPRAGCGLGLGADCRRKTTVVPNLAWNRGRLVADPGRRRTVAGGTRVLSRGRPSAARRRIKRSRGWAWLALDQNWARGSGRLAFKRLWGPPAGSFHAVWAKVGGAAFDWALPCGPAGGKAVVFFSRGVNLHGRGLAWARFPRA